MNRVETYRSIFAEMKESGGEPPSQEILDQFYGPSWELDLELIDRIDKQTKQEGEIESYLSLGHYTIEKREGLRREEIRQRKNDPSYRREKNRLGIGILAVVAGIAAIFAVLEILVPAETVSSPLAEKIATAILIGGIGAVVGLIGDFRRRNN